MKLQKIPATWAFRLFVGWSESASSSGPNKTDYPTIETVEIERFLLAVLSEPQRLAGLQVADHGDELHLLTEVDLVYTHLLQAILTPPGTPSLQIPQVDGTYRAGRQPGYRVYRYEIDPAAKTLRLWVRRKPGHHKLDLFGLRTEV